MSAVPVQKPIIVTRPKPQLRIEQGTKPRANSKVLTRSILFGVLTLSVFFASSLVGQVMVEKARREGIRSVERAKDAAKDVALLRDRFQSMSRASAIDGWALSHDLIAPESITAEQDSSDVKTVH